MGIHFYKKIKGDGRITPFYPDVPKGIDWTAGSYDKNYQNVLISSEQEIVGDVNLTDAELTTKCAELKIDKIKFTSQSCAKYKNKDCTKCLNKSCARCIAPDCEKCIAPKWKECKETKCVDCGNSDCDKRKLPEV